MLEEDIDKLNQGRLLRDASTHLMPLLEKMKVSALAKIIMAHRSSEADKLPQLAAELSVISELADKLTRNNKETNTREERFHEATRPRD